MAYPVWHILYVVELVRFIRELGMDIVCDDHVVIATPIFLISDPESVIAHVVGSSLQLSKAMTRAGNGPTYSVLESGWLRNVARMVTSKDVGDTEVADEGLIAGGGRRRVLVIPLYIRRATLDHKAQPASHKKREKDTARTAQ